VVKNTSYEASAHADPFVSAAVSMRGAYVQTWVVS
jgi:hypothetical protein